MQPVAAQNPTTVSKQESLILANDIGVAVSSSEIDDDLRECTV